MTPTKHTVQREKEKFAVTYQANPRSNTHVRWFHKTPEQIRQAVIFLREIEHRGGKGYAQNHTLHSKNSYKYWLWMLLPGNKDYELTDQEINQIHNRILTALKAEFDIELR